jgi:hemoglobin/transferrin/lactoferrin receptor protein
MNKISLTLCILFIFNTLKAQNTPVTPLEKDTAQLDEIVVSAHKVSENKFRVAQHIEIITSQRIAQLNTASVAELLSSEGKVTVQKSQQGGGSPTLRGFEASRILLVVDGVRLNNLIYRSGHLQNILTLDQNILQRVEVMYGAASTVYGSDALGGVIHFLTKKPLRNTTTNSALQVNGSVFSRYGTVNQEKAFHADVNLGSKKWASLTSFSFSSFGDLKMGKKTQFLDTLWGLRPFYVERIGEKDSILKNDNIYLQKFSGYNQYDILQKVLFQPNLNATHLLNFQFSNSSYIPRYDRLTDTDARGELRQAEWNYGPQTRFLAAYDMNWKENFKFGLNYQSLEESRFSRTFGSSARTSRVENVQVLGANADYVHKKNSHDLRLGIDFQYGTVASRASQQNVNSLEIKKASTRYPSGFNSQLNTAIFATYTRNLSPKWVLNSGLRATHIRLNADFKNDTSFYKINLGKFEQNNTATVGTLGLVFTPTKNFRLSLLHSSGFRAPNIDDLGKVFDTDTRNKRVIVPNPDLKPERTYNFEIHPSWLLGKKFRLEASAFYTAFRNAIVVDKFQLNNSDSILYEGIKSEVVANINKQKAQIWGFSVQLKSEIIENWIFTANYAFTKGNIISADNKLSPLDHTPPSNGRVGLLFKPERWQFEIFSLFNSRKKWADYFRNGEDNEQYALLYYGMPAWCTANFRAAYKPSAAWSVQAGAENILDIQYRTFASGIHAPGRNFYGAVRFYF